MRPDLLDSCPLAAPTPARTPLSLAALAEDPLTGDIIEGWLLDDSTGGRYPIIDGVPLLVPEPAWYVAARPDCWRLEDLISSELRAWAGGLIAPSIYDKYNDSRVLNEYLWIHFDGLIEPPAPSLPSPMEGFFGPVATAISPRTGLVIDAGCNVGRLTFEAAAQAQFALGFDYSWAAIAAARQLMRQGSMTYQKRLEGLITEPITITAPPTRNLDFIVADAMAPPLPLNAAEALIAMNLLDRVPDPLACLEALHHTVAPQGQFIITDPFSWDSAYAPPEKWLGGTTAGDFAGPGVAVLRRLLKERGYTLEPQREVTLVIRETARFYQVSCAALIAATKGV